MAELLPSVNGFVPVHWDCYAAPMPGLLKALQTASSICSFVSIWIESLREISDLREYLDQYFLL